MRKHTHSPTQAQAREIIFKLPAKFSTLTFRERSTRMSQYVDEQNVRLAFIKGFEVVQLPLLFLFHQELQCLFTFSTSLPQLQSLDKINQIWGDCIAQR